MEFSEKKRLKIHYKTHEKSNEKNKTEKTVMPDFEKPDFSHIM